MYNIWLLLLQRVAPRVGPSMFGPSNHRCTGGTLLQCAHQMRPTQGHKHVLREYNEHLESLFLGTVHAPVAVELGRLWVTCIASDHRAYN